MGDEHFEYPFREESLRVTLQASSEKRIAELMATAQREKSRADKLQSELEAARQSRKRLVWLVRNYRLFVQQWQGAYDNDC